jgi:predicted metalloprotease with PDZ domain
MRVKRASGLQAPPEEKLVMPVWTPGSYMIREFSRHVQDFSVSNVAGEPLKWEKQDKNTWRIWTAGAVEWKATYRVYANELTVRTSELNSDHAFWNNATLLMYLDGFLKAPATLRVLAPEVWKVATGLPAVPGTRNTFRAENFDILFDSPVEASNFKNISFQVKGVPHRIVIDGEGNYDAVRLREDVQKIVTSQIQLMGGEVPYKDYTFILHLRGNASGAIEHANSTALSYPRFGFHIAKGERLTSASPAPSGVEPERDYRGFLSIIAHEFFHVWNVKRIRPDALGPFDYTKENYTRLLWVAEGVTNYYADLTLLRAGLISDKEFLVNIAREIQSLQSRPGRLVQSVEEASFDSWVKFYRQDENSINSQVSYYDKGALLGLLLDLEIRKASNGAKSLDDTMRALYTDFYKQERNYTPEDFQKICEKIAGANLQQFFAKYVRGRDELDYNAALSVAGLWLDMNANPEVQQTPTFGADLSDVGDRLIVQRVYAGSPAYEQGLNAGDQIVAVNNMRADRQFFEARLAEKKPGDILNLTIFRADDLSTLIIKLGERAAPNYRIVAVATPTEQQKSVYKSWLGFALTN